MSIPPRPEYEPHRSYDYAVIGTHGVSPTTTHRNRRIGLLALAVIVLLLLWWGRTAEQWQHHGCNSGMSAGLALSEGEPEWYQWCTDRPTERTL